jgi:hypothetical protein
MVTRKDMLCDAAISTEGSNSIWIGARVAGDAGQETEQNATVVLPYRNSVETRNTYLNPLLQQSRAYEDFVLNDRRDSDLSKTPGLKMLMDTTAL